MKKLLAILASLTVAGSGASAVVACSMNPTNVPADDNNNGDYDPNAAANDNGNSSSDTTNGGNAKPSDNSKPNGKDDNKDNDNNNKQDGIVTTNFNKEEERNLEIDAQTAATNKILQDQFGLDGTYADGYVKMPDGSTINTNNMYTGGAYGASTTPLISILVKAGAIKPDQAKTITDDVLPLIMPGGRWMDLPSPSAIGGMLSGTLPILGSLQPVVKGAISDPQKIKDGADQIFNNPLVKSILLNLTNTDNSLDMSKYASLTVGDAMKSVMVGIAFIVAAGTNDDASASAYRNLANVNDANVSKAIDYVAKRLLVILNTPKIIDASVDVNSKQITLTGKNLTEDMFTGNHWSLSYKSDLQDNDDASKNVQVNVKKGKAADGSEDNTKITITFDDKDFAKDGTGKYNLVYSNRGTDSNSDIKISFNSSVSEASPVITSGVSEAPVYSFSKPAIDSSQLLNIDFNSLGTAADIETITDMLKMFGMYIEQFIAYQAPDDAKAPESGDAIFWDKATGKYISTFDTINKVRSVKLTEVTYKFNALKLIKNISYYLGKLDSKESVYRLQSLISIFFIDDVNRSGEKQLMLNWDSDYNKVSGLTLQNGGEGTKTPVAELINTFIYDFLSANEPEAWEQILDTIRSTGKIGTFAPLGGLADGLKWDVVVESLRHNVYMIMQSLAWNTGFTMSDGKLADILPMSAIDDGWQGAYKLLSVLVRFSGLNSMPQWKNLEKDGILDFLFEGNVSELVKEAYTTKAMNDTYSDIDKFSKGTKDKIISALKDISVKLDSFASQGKVLSTTLDMQNNFSSYDQLTFKNANGTSVLNTNVGKTHEMTAVDPNGQAIPNWRKSKHTHASSVPTIDKVISTYSDADNKSTVYIWASDIFNDGFTNYTYVDHNGSNVSKSWTPSIKTFGDSLKITNSDGKQLKIIGDVSNSNDGKTYSKTLLKATVEGKLDDNAKVQAKTFWYEGYDTGDMWSGWKKTYFGDIAWIGNDSVNILWSQDELGLNNLFNLGSNFQYSDKNPKLAALNTSQLNLDDKWADKLKDLQITDKDGKTVGKVNINYETALNVKTLAGKNLSWILGMLGLETFNRQDSPLGLPIADNSTLGSLILQIGDLIGEDSDDEALTNSMEPKRFKYLVKVLLGDEKGNIVDKIIDAIEAPSGTEMVNQLTPLLGINGGNSYSKNGLIGALITAFTPDAIYANDDNSPNVQGNSKAATPLWTYVIDKVEKAWGIINGEDNSKLINDMANTNNFVFGWNNPNQVVVDKNNPDRILSMSINITYKYTWTTFVKSDKDVEQQDKTATGTYTLDIDNSDPTKVKYSIKRTDKDNSDGAFSNAPSMNTDVKINGAKISEDGKTITLSTDALKRRALVTDFTIKDATIVSVSGKAGDKQIVITLKDPIKKGTDLTIEAKNYATPKIEVAWPNQK